MGLRHDVFYLTSFLAILEQLSICGFHKLAHSLITDHLAEAREVESGDHIPPILPNQVTHEELLSKSTMLIFFLFFTFANKFRSQVVAYSLLVEPAHLNFCFTLLLCAH